MRLFTLAAVLYTVILPLSVHGGDTQSVNGEISALKVLEARSPVSYDPQSRLTCLICPSKYQCA
jgi:hypothetical protein